MKLDHVALNVKDIRESVSWYQKHLNANVSYQDSTWALMEVGGTKIALTLASQHPPHIAFCIHQDSEIPCESQDIRVHRDGSRYYYHKDPDGNVIEWIIYPEC